MSRKYQQASQEFLSWALSFVLLYHKANFTLSVNNGTPHGHEKTAHWIGRKQARRRWLCGLKPGVYGKRKPGPYVHEAYATVVFDIFLGGGGLSSVAYSPGPSFGNPFQLSKYFYTFRQSIPFWASFHGSFFFNKVE